MRQEDFLVLNMDLDYIYLIEFQAVIVHKYPNLLNLFYAKNQLLLMVDNLNLF